MSYETLLKHLPGKHTQDTHGHGGADLGAAKSTVTDRAKKLGYNVKFEQTDKGLQIIGGKPGKAMKKMDIYINSEGVVVDSKGKKKIGWN